MIRSKEGVFEDFDYTTWTDSYILSPTTKAKEIDQKQKQNRKIFNFLTNTDQGKYCVFSDQASSSSGDSSKLEAYNSDSWQKEVLNKNG